MGLRSSNLINYGGGGGNQLNAVAIPALINPLPGDFLVYIICWQAGLPQGGYVPVQPAFQVSDDKGQRWQNLFDLFDPNGPGGAYSSQFSMSVWFCDSAKGGTFNITTTSSAVPLLQDQQGHGSIQDWQLDNRNQIVTAQKIDHSGTTTPALPAFIAKANQLLIAAFWAVNSNPVLVAAGAGYTIINTFGTTIDYLDEYIVRPPPGANAPGITVTAPPAIWEMVALQIDISQPALGVGNIQFANDFRQMPIEE